LQIKSTKQVRQSKFYPGTGKSKQLVIFASYCDEIPTQLVSCKNEIGVSN